MSPRQATVPAFAKINLGLRILYKRPDNYHELRTVFQTISLADTLTLRFEPADQTSVVIEGTPEIPDNLVERAARLLLDQMGRSGAVHCVLTKRIPSGAGLGGGSSDAAAVLLALPALIGQPVPMSNLAALGAKLGSDVPFFLYGGTALGLGRGEELYPLPDYPQQKGLLVTPPVHSSTPEAYKAISAGLTSISLQNKLERFQQEVWQGASSLDGNDFEGVVFARHPELQGIKNGLLGAGAAFSAMSGSGSSVFGFFPSDEGVELAAKALHQYPSHPFRLIHRAEYRQLWADALGYSGSIQNLTTGTEWPPQNPQE